MCARSGFSTSPKLRIFTFFQADSSSVGGDRACNVFNPADRTCLLPVLAQLAGQTLSATQPALECDCMPACTDTEYETT